MKKKKLKIIHLIGSLNPGGVQTYILNIARYDIKHNIDREVCTIYQERGLLFKNFIENNINVSCCPIIPIDKNWRPYFLWKKLRYLGGYLFFIRLYRKLNSSKPDIIIADEPASLITQFLVSKILNIPLIWFIHAERVIIKKRRILRFLLKYFLNNLSIISDSKYVLLKNIGPLKPYLNINIEKIPIIHPTVDLKKILKINIKKIDNSKIHKEPIQIGSIGRLNWAKGYDLLIEALHILKSEFSNFHVKIAGDGPYRKLIEEMIEKYSLKSNIKILGELHYNEIPDFLNSIDIYIQPSVSEGSPITIKEAMAAGLPILTSSAGGIPEVIKNNKTGLIFENRNVDHLKRKLVKIINMSFAQKREMGIEARKEVVKNYGIDKTAEKLADNYKMVYKQSIAKN